LLPIEMMGQTDDNKENSSILRTNINHKDSILRAKTEETLRDAAYRRPKIFN